MTAVDKPTTARVRVPATCANLGPGFDALGLAIGLRDDLIARITGGGVTVRVRGEGAGELPTGADHLVVRAMDAAFDLLGERPDGLDLECVNRIPQARGLGSSSAAIVGGVLLARALVAEGTARLDDMAALRLAADLEGHPDNVAPCLLGGFTIAWTQPDGAHAVRLEPDTALAPVVFVPRGRGLTAAARAALPPTVPHGDAAATVGRAALLVHALTAAPSCLFAATDDWLHQKYRAGVMPETASIVNMLRNKGLPAVVSGAGPSVLVFAESGWIPPTLTGWNVLRAPVDRTGAMVLAPPGTVKHAEQDAVATDPAS
ncbi:MAG: homoserine kinase [Dactylosporangium sp.]|nr:homoserine kinase [Dactylosporangium sp.]NNJ60798.1 homoserine kinase [Dactylosporangium sp.]